MHLHQTMTPSPSLTLWWINTVLCCHCFSTKGRQGLSNRCFKWQEETFPMHQDSPETWKQAHQSFSRTEPYFPRSMPTGHHSPLHLSCNHNRPPDTSCSSLPNSPLSPPGIRANRSFHSKSPIASMVLASRSTFSVICLISPNAPLLGRVMGLLAIMSA